MLATLVEPGEQKGLWRGEVEEWRNLAGSSSGLERYEHLQHALNRGLTEIADQITCAAGTGAGRLETAPRRPSTATPERRPRRRGLDYDNRSASCVRDFTASGLAR
jgi:hypothetical protein